MLHFEEWKQEGEYQHSDDVTGKDVVERWRKPASLLLRGTLTLSLLPELPGGPVA